MAKHSSSILALARRGAQHRYEELQEELSSLVQQFPDLRGAARAIVKRGRRAVQAVQAAAAELQPRKRRTMSPAARAKIAAAQRARWAKRKAAAAVQSVAVTVKARKKR